MITKLFKDAFLCAKKKHAKLKDISILSKKLQLRTGGVDIFWGPRKMTDNAIAQLARIANIPPAWIKTKRQMEDCTHLVESFSRHFGMQDTHKLVLRTDETGNVFAVFKDGVTQIDILPMLRLVREYVGAAVTNWKIQIVDHKLTLLGRMKTKTSPDLFPAIFITTSEDGSLGIRCGVAAERKWQFALFDSDQYPFWSFKRTESKPGDLQFRVSKALAKLFDWRIPVIKDSFRLYAEIRKNPCGENTVRLIEFGRKYLTLPKHSDSLVLGTYVKPTIGGYFNALMRLSESEQNPHHRQAFARAAGVVLSAGNSGINLQLAEISREKSG